MVRNLLALLAAAVVSLPALAQSEEQLISRYTAFAGSKENANSLVTGLRDGKQVTLTRGTTKETFTPPTGKMGYGNIDNALALAEASLAKQGITNPTPTQLEAALVGKDGILQMRAAGQGWGQIAHSMDIKLGDVKRSDKAPERVSKVDRPNRPEKPEKPQRPERPERPEKPEKPAR
jgi:hypothetical protein